MTRYELFYGGAWQSPTSGRYFPVENPANAEQLAEVAAAEKTDIDAAAGASRRSLLDTDWAHNPRRRAKALKQWAQLIAGKAEELAVQLTAENGKRLGESRAEIMGAVDSLEFYGGLSRSLYGRAAEFIPDVHGIILREPVGVVAVIVPWNWPVVLAMRAVAPALATGNTVVIKPASLTPITTLKLVGLAKDIADFPPGVLNVITGAGNQVGTALVTHPDVNMISFTGDTETGMDVMRKAAGSLKKTSLELGGKSANIVFADADLLKAVKGAMNAAFTTCGQICTAGSRLLVHEDVYEEFLASLCNAAASLRVGDGMDGATEMGPLISAGQFEKVMSCVDIGKREARLLVGGTRLTHGGLGRGYFMAPTIFADVPKHSSLWRKEIFGPVLVVDRFRTDEEAIDKANDSEYGLAAGIWSENLSRVMRVSRALQAGTIWVNTYHQFYNEAEVGGYKNSGIGRHQGLEVLHEFSQVKHINLDSRSAWVASR